MQRFLLVVFDGLRPDMMRHDTTPNLMRFAAMGTRFARARSVFPSETRVCSSSVATGCLPRRHGLVANQFAHPLDPRRVVDAGSGAALRALQQETGAPVLEVPTLGDLLAAAGHDCAVFSSGTTGQTFVLNPRADETGQIVLSAHGAQACSTAGRAVLATLDPPPTAPVDRCVWIAEAFRARILPEPPAASILWLCEPDSTGHYGGLGSPAQLDALKRADAAFGRVLDDWQAGPHRDALQIAVASDHGHATVTGRQDVRAALPGFADCTVIAGSSGGIFVPGGDRARISSLADWLIRQDWCGPVYAADNADRPEGVLPRSALLADHHRAAHVLYMLRGGAGQSGAGLPGVTLYDGGLELGSGTHGGLLAAELHIVLMLAGSMVRRGETSDWPAGLPDIAPTALALLGLPGAAAMDGRVLGEALLEHPARTDAPAGESWQAAAPGYTQTLARTRLGRHVYIDHGTRG